MLVLWMFFGWIRLLCSLRTDLYMSHKFKTNVSCHSDVYIYLKVADSQVS